MKKKLKNLSIDSIKPEYDVRYVWYYALLNERDIKIVSKAIKKHNFELFMEIYSKYKKDESDGFESFPSTAYVWKGYKLIGVVEILNKKGFEKITENECENG